MKKALSGAVLVVLALLLSAQFSSAADYRKFLRPQEGLLSFVIEDDTISLRAIRFQTEQRSGVTLTVQQIEADEEWIYDYFIIDAAGLQDMPENVLIDLRVSKYWINVNNVQESTLGLNIFRDAWERLEIEMYDEDADFFYYRADSPELEALFAVTGEPVPVEFETISECNGNDICEPAEGEDAENCGDCLKRVMTDVCVPFQITCAGDYVMECGRSGTDYELTLCDFSCSDGACVTPALLPAAGMFISQNSAYLAVVAILSSIIAYLVFSLRRTREALIRIEKIASTQDDLKVLTEERKD
ncbi:MAG: PGF-pre-PGF domain-containing protein [Candidatus Aenigmatarchaeota archaeon]|nr:MAG: PGF-pre-PGF domain-containing protein [Candidatus Aenigmarchaeota archaeon]